MELLALRPKSRSQYLTRGTRSAVKAWLPSKTAREEQLEVLTARKPGPVDRCDQGESFDPIEAAINKSTYIGELSDNWDDAGAKAISREIWQRAVNFLRASAVALRQDCGVAIEAPRILPGPDGTVDLHWQNDRFLLLINITESGSSDFYGETPDGLSVKGNFIPELHQQGILSWLKDHGRKI